MKQRDCHKKPPYFATWILNRILQDEHWERPLGDFEEYYNDLIAKNGLFKTWFWYWYQVIILIPGRLVNSFW